MLREEFHLLTDCPNCHSVCETWTDYLPRPNVDAEAASDAEVVVSHEIECERCGDTCEVVVTAHLTGWSAHLADDPRHAVTVNHLDYGDDDWLEELEPEPHPYTNYKTAVAEWRNLLRSLGEEDGSSGINRMLLVQLFSVLEAYLADALISLVHRNVAVQNAIVSWHEELRTEKVTLLSITENPNIVRDMVISKLRLIQFHRFERVNGMVRASLKHHLLPTDKTERDFVIQSAKIRHGCVHRNGNDDEGKPFGNVTRRYLEQLEAHFSEIAVRLDEVIDDFEKPKVEFDADNPWFDFDFTDSGTATNPWSGAKSVPVPQT